MTWINLGEFYVILGQITGNAKQKLSQVLDIVIFVDNFSKLEVLAPDIKLFQIPLVRLGLSFLFLMIS
jgi:hypothetical protein